MCLMCLSGCQFVCGLWPRVGRRPPGIYPSRLCLFCVELSAALRMTPSTDSNPPFPSTRRILDQLLTRGPLGRPLTPTNGTLYPSIHRGQAAFGAVLVWRKRAVLCPEVERSAVLVPRASRDDHLPLQLPIRTPAFPGRICPLRGRMLLGVPQDRDALRSGQTLHDLARPPKGVATVARGGAQGALERLSVDVGGVNARTRDESSRTVFPDQHPPRSPSCGCGVIAGLW